MTVNEISLCMIVKDEAAQIPHCLQSVAKLVQEIIIVDTGSTDTTKSIAKSLGAQVHDYSWDDNFSNARNYSLSLASKPWILVLDADETLSGDNSLDDDLPSVIRDLLSDPKSEGYFLRIINQLSPANPKPTSEDFVVRLFRNKPEYRFYGAIHEQIRPAIVQHAGEYSLEYAPLTINHQGYLPSVLQQKDKFERNTRIIKKALKLSPQDPFLLYYLGTEYLLIQQYQRAFTVFEEALKIINPQAGYLPDLLLKLVLCLHQLGGLGEYLQTCPNAYKLALLKELDVATDTDLIIYLILISCHAAIKSKEAQFLSKLTDCFPINASTELNIRLQSTLYLCKALYFYLFYVSSTNFLGSDALCAQILTHMKVIRSWKEF